MAGERVEVTRRGAVATITIRRPEMRNVRANAADVGATTDDDS